MCIRDRVTHSSKNAVENHFDTSYELEALLEQRVKRQLLAEVQAICPPGVTIMNVRPVSYTHLKQRFPGMTPAAIARYARRWQPMRSYALLHIWYTDDWIPAAE